MPKKITIQTKINAPIDIVWEYWNEEEHITQWNAASKDWHCPTATNNLKVNGKFLYRMEAKDGSFGFDFSGTYNEVIPKKLIKYQLDDDRQVENHFEEINNQTVVTSIFEAEDINSLEMQKQGWLAILNNFRIYVEEN